MAWYLAYVVEREIVGCLLKAQDIAPKPMLNTYIEVYFPSSLSPIVRI